MVGIDQVVGLGGQVGGPDRGKAATMTKDDQWSRWVLKDRIGTDPEIADQRQAEVERYRDTVLRNAALVPGDVVLDVGTGDGLIGFGAIDLLGGKGSIILSDVSQPLLDHALEKAAKRGIADRCRALLASAHDLSNLETESVDVVTTRSVLIYVKQKMKAISEFYRVLRAGGRLSIFEPINRDMRQESRPGRFWGCDGGPVVDLVHRFDESDLVRPLDDDPMTDVTERDLVGFCTAAGFTRVHLDLRIDIEPVPPRPWASLLEFTPNPLAPKLGDAFAKLFSPDEMKRFEDHFRPLVEAGHGVWRRTGAYLWAAK